MDRVRNGIIMKERVKELRKAIEEDIELFDSAVARVYLRVIVAILKDIENVQ